MWKYTGTKECNEFLLSLNLFNCNDEKKYIRTLYAIANNVENNYRVYKIKKRNGNYRTIYEPNDLLKEIQRNILDNVLSDRQVSSYAKAYYKGISLRDNAIPHQNKDIILKLDIKNFFESISFMDVYNSCFPIEYFPKSVGMLLTYLCTYNEHLTQGSPTSAFISNLVLKKFDEEIGAYALLNNIDYTRYSDDMTFSGNFVPDEIISKVRHMLYKYGLELNNDKIHIVKSSASQMVTGIVVNQKIQVSSKYRKDIRKNIYYIKKYGIDSHMKKINMNVSRDKYVDILYGKIIYVLQVNPEDKEFVLYRDYVRNLKKQL